MSPGNIEGETADQSAVKASGIILGKWMGERVTRVGLDGLSRARPVVVQHSHRSEVLDVGSEEVG